MAAEIEGGFGKATALGSPLTDDREVPRGRGRVEIGLLEELLRVLGASRLSFIAGRSRGGGQWWR